MWLLALPFIIAATAIPAPAPSTAPSGVPDTESWRAWTVRLYLEENRLAPNTATTCIIAVRNDSSRAVRISNAVNFERIAIDRDGAERKFGWVPGVKGTEVDPKAPCVVVAIKGSYQGRVESMLGVKFLRIDTIELSPGQTHLFLEPLPGPTFQRGRYTLQAELREDGVTLSRSKMAEMQIVADKPEATTKARSK